MMPGRNLDPERGQPPAIREYPVLQSGLMDHRKFDANQTRSVLRKIPFAMLLGMRLVRLHRDGITLECTLNDNLLNSAGALHGGVSAALADAAVGVAIHRHLGEYRPITTVEMTINYFRPVTEGRVSARSRLLRVGSTLCAGRVDITDAQKRVAGTAIVTYMRVGATKAASSGRLPTARLGSDRR
jgi:uncharacterized protein (TIGR00369 family)